MREPAYRDRIRKAYPFHPELIDVLFEKWSTFPHFQRTRGVLRILAQMVNELYKSNHSAPLILPAHINLTNPSVRGEFLRHIGDEYQGVIASDITGENAKSERIDREMGSEYAQFGVAGGLARAIFFASFSGSEKRGVGIQRLRLSALQPEIPPAIIGDAMQRLEDELWYLHAERGTYWFSNQPNLNRVIVEKEEGVTPNQIAEEIRARLEKLSGSEMRVTLWPQVSQDVPDTRELKLAVISPEYPRQSRDTVTFAQEILEKCGQTFRIYKNTMILLATDGNEFESVRRQVKRYLAYYTIKDDKTLYHQLSEENRKWLENKIKDVDNGIAYQLLSAYRHVVKADERGFRWLDLGLPTVGIRPSLTRRVHEYLSGEDMLLSKISPRLVLEKTLREDENRKSVEEIYDAFLKYPNLPMLKDKQVLLEAIVQGVQEGIFGVSIGERIFFNVKISISQLELEEAIVVREPMVTPPPPPPPPPPHQPPKPVVKTRYKLRSVIPWDKLSDFVRGVVMPLRQDGADLKVEVTLEACAEEGFKQTTLDQKVRETLKQIGADILEERTE